MIPILPMLSRQIFLFNSILVFCLMVTSCSNDISISSCQFNSNSNSNSISENIHQFDDLILTLKNQQNSGIVALTKASQLIVRKEYVKSQNDDLVQLSFVTNYSNRFIVFQLHSYGGHQPYKRHFRLIDIQKRSILDLGQIIEISRKSWISSDSISFKGKTIQLYPEFMVLPG